VPRSSQKEEPESEEEQESQEEITFTIELPSSDAFRSYFEKWQKDMHQEEEPEIQVAKEIVGW
jgi:hypothetical protein